MRLLPPITLQLSAAAISTWLQSHCAGVIWSLHNKPQALVRVLRYVRFFP